MNALSIILLALIAAWFVYAVVRMIRRRGCGCGSCEGCGGCARCGSCADCKRNRNMKTKKS